MGLAYQPFLMPLGGSPSPLGGGPFGGCRSCAKPLGGCLCPCCTPPWSACFPGVNPATFMVDFATDQGAVSTTLTRQTNFVPVTLPGQLGANGLIPWTGTPDDIASAGSGFLYNTVPFWPYRELIDSGCKWQSPVLDNIPGYGGPGVFYLIGGDEPEGLSGGYLWITLLWVYVYQSQGAYITYSGASLFNCQGTPGWPLFNPTAHNPVWWDQNAEPIPGLMLDVYPG